MDEEAAEAAAEGDGDAIEDVVRKITTRIQVGSEGDGVASGDSGVSAVIFEPEGVVGQTAEALVVFVFAVLSMSGASFCCVGVIIVVITNNTDNNKLSCCGQNGRFDAGLVPV